MAGSATLTMNRSSWAMKATAASTARISHRRGCPSSVSGGTAAAVPASAAVASAIAPPGPVVSSVNRPLNPIWVSIARTRRSPVPALERLDDVVVLDLGDTENRFHPDWLSDMPARPDAGGEKDGPRARVVTATGRFFSNGLDLEWLSAHESERTAYLASTQELLARVVALPMGPGAGIPGAAFAAGAMLTLACDFRVMRADRGFWCLPEADIGMSFSPGMTALIQSRL